MARKIVFYGGAAAALWLSTVAALLLSGAPQNLWRKREIQPVINLEDVFNTAGTGSQLRLFAGETAPATCGLLGLPDRATEITDDSNMTRMRFIKNTDGSSADIWLKPDGEHFTSCQSYYPQKPGEIGRRPHIKQVYAGSSDLVVEQTTYREDGTLEEEATESEDGAKHVLGYGANGKTMIHDLVVDPRQDRFSQPILVKEMRWRDDASNSLEYSNILDPADGKRVITFWDENHRPLKVIVPGFVGINYGTTTTAYYAGTSIIRMQSTVELEYNVAKYFRLNGTLDHVLKLTERSTTIQYFDESGKNMLLEQNWDRVDLIENGKKKSRYTISMVTKKDASGDDAFNVYFLEGELNAIAFYNLEIAGIKFSEVDYVYDTVTRAVERILYWIGNSHHPFDKEETSSSGTKLSGPSLPAEYLKMQVNPDEDDDLLPPDPRSPEE